MNSDLIKRLRDAETAIVSPWPHMLLQEAAKVLEANEWRTMETQPVDLSRGLVVDDGKVVLATYLEGPELWMDDCDNEFLPNATTWKPITPPKEIA